MSRTFTRRGGAVAAALALGVTPTVLAVVPAADVQLTTPAQAAVTQGPGYRTWATFIGIDIVNGKRTICISSGEAVPSSLPTPAPVADGKTAYLMWRYLGTNDDVTAAALAVVVKREHDEHPGEVEKGLAELDAATRSAIEARAKAMLAEAQEKAGPYDLTMDLKAKAGSNPTTGTVEDIAVLGRGGEPVNLDANITLTLSGPGVFTRNGKRTITVPTLSAAQSLGWKATAAGKVTVSGTVKGLPPTRFNRYVAPVPYEQNMAGLYAGLTDIRGGDPKEEPTRVDCTPKIATQIITDQDTSGALTLKDAWKVTGDCKNKSFPVTITWYHVPTKPTAPSATVPADAKSLGSSTFTVTTDAQGTASGTATGKKVTLPGGAVVARERIATVKGVKGSWSPFGVASESMLVPCAVQLRTKLATAAVNEPGKVAIADTVTATSNCTSRSVDAEVTLFRDTAKPVLAATAPATARAPGVVGPAGAAHPSPGGVGRALQGLQPLHEVGVDLDDLVGDPVVGVAVLAEDGAAVVDEQVEQLASDHHVLPQRHRSVLGHDDGGVAADGPQPGTELLGVGHGRRQRDHLHRLGQVDDDLLPHGAAEPVGEVVDLVHDDDAEVVQRGAPGIQHVAQDLGGHDDHGGLAVDGRVAREQADPVGAVTGDEVVVLLVG